MTLYLRTAAPHSGRRPAHVQTTITVGPHVLECASVRGTPLHEYRLMRGAQLVRSFLSVPTVTDCDRALQTGACSGFGVARTVQQRPEKCRKSERTR